MRPQTRSNYDIQTIASVPGFAVSTCSQLMVNAASVSPSYVAESGHLILPMRTTDATEDGTTSLYIASKHGVVELVEKLLAAAEKADQALPNEKTALHAACAMGHLQVVEKLLAAGASTDSRTSDGITPMGLAITYRHREVYERLLAARLKACLVHSLCAGHSSSLLKDQSSIAAKTKDEAQRRLPDSLSAEMQSVPLSEASKLQTRVLMEILKRSEAYEAHVQLIDQVMELCRCPISFEAMKDPVMTPSGISYERVMIGRHLEANGPFDPTTKTRSTKADLRPNRMLWQLVEMMMPTIEAAERDDELVDR